MKGHNKATRDVLAAAAVAGTQESVNPSGFFHTDEITNVSYNEPDTESAASFTHQQQQQSSLQETLSNATIPANGTPGVPQASTSRLSSTSAAAVLARAPLEQHSFPSLNLQQRILMEEDGAYRNNSDSRQQQLQQILGNQPAAQSLSSPLELFNRGSLNDAELWRENSYLDENFQHLLLPHLSAREPNYTNSANGNLGSIVDINNNNNRYHYSSAQLASTSTKRQKTLETNVQNSALRSTSGSTQNVPFSHFSHYLQEQHNANINSRELIHRSAHQTGTLNQSGTPVQRHRDGSVSKWITVRGAGNTNKNSSSNSSSSSSLAYTHTSSISLMSNMAATVSSPLSAGSSVSEDYLATISEAPPAFVLPQSKVFASTATATTSTFVAPTTSISGFGQLAQHRPPPQHGQAHQHQRQAHLMAAQTSSASLAVAAAAATGDYFGVPGNFLPVTTSTSNTINNNNSNVERRKKPYQNYQNYPLVIGLELNSPSSFKQIIFTGFTAQSNRHVQLEFFCKRCGVTSRVSPTEVERHIYQAHLMEMIAEKQPKSHLQKVKVAYDMVRKMVSRRLVCVTTPGQ